MSEAYLNYLTERNGAVVVGATSEFRENHSHSILTDEVSVRCTQSLWLSGEGLPQTLLVDISSLRQRPALLKSFGWLCWKAFNSNPAVVELAASADGKEFEELGVLLGKEVAGPQFFPIRPVRRDHTFLRLVIRETFGGTKTYMNQVFLLEEMPGTTTQPDPQELKSLLKRQLSTLEENVRNMQAEQLTLPSARVQSLPRARSTVPSDKPSPILLTEVSVAKDDDLAALHDTLKALSDQVKTLQEQVSGQKNIEALRDIKRQLLLELAQKEERLATEPSQQDFLRSWQERVLEPRLAQFEARILSLMKKPRVDDMMSQLQEKIRKRNEKLALLEQQKAGYRDSYSSLY